jgi:hypothetical protein
VTTNVADFMFKLTSPVTDVPTDMPLTSLVSLEQVPPSTTTYFYLELVDTTTVDDSWQDPNELQIIKPGKTYELRISISVQNLYQQYLKQPPCHIRNSIDIHIPASLNLTVEDQDGALSREEILLSLGSSKTLHTWNVTLPESCPTSDVIFKVLYRESQTRQRPLIAASLQVRVAGTYDSDEVELLKASKVKLNVSLPDQAAVLHIAQAANNMLTIKGLSKGAGKLSIDRMSWEPIKLADFVEQGVQPGEVIESVRRFSRTSAGELIGWLKKLIVQYGKQFALVIFDHTDLETPWEMLGIGDQGYLGAQALVVRWMDIRYYESWCPLQMSDVQKRGSVITYLDKEGLGEQQTYPEREAFKGLKVKNYSDLQSLKEVLGQPDEQQDLGLIYLGCHGYEGMSIGSQRDISKRITYLNLEIPVAYPDPRPIVFVNACESARLKRDGGDYFKGLLEVLLARFAAGYIGTLGPVGSTYASTVAQELLQAASKGPIQIAEVLRRLREEAFEALIGSEQAEVEKRKRDFLYAFMYVYYGNALVRLSLEDDEAGGAEA